MSIRLRFTLLYTGILALTLIVFSLMLYTIQFQTRLNFHEETLAGMSRRVTDGLRREMRPDDALERRSPDRDQLRQADRPGSPLGEPELYFQIITADEELGLQSENLGEVVLPLSDAGRQALQTGEPGEPWTEIVFVQGERLLIYNEPVETEGRVTEIVQIARSLADWQHNLDALGRNLFIGSSVVIIAAFGIGWALSGVVLRPIDRITRTAQAIGSERDFNRRVEFAGPNDEVGKLANTFNTMLTELQAAYQQIEGALQMQRRFVADVSHELRTPLTTIRGNIELLRRMPPISTEDQAAVVTDIVDETERLIRLVNDLLMLEHSDAGQHLRSEPLLIGPLIEDACQQARLLDPDRSIICSASRDAAVAGDPDALKQVLLILLDNALKHTNGTISVMTAVDEVGVAISIQDAGPGIEPAALPHVFERFYRGDEARSTAGTGLGLPIAKALVEAQNGTIRVESDVERGSVFTVALPGAVGHR